MDLIIIDGEHYDHTDMGPNVYWAPCFRCAANPDTTGAWGFTQDQSNKFCQKAAQYWNTHPKAKRWLNPFRFLAMCYDGAYGSFNPDNQWQPDPGAVVRGLLTGTYDIYQPLRLLAPVIGKLRCTHGIELDGVYVDAEDGPDASLPQYQEAFNIWHHATNGNEQEFWKAGKDAQYNTARKILDTLGCKKTHLVVIECNGRPFTTKHWWTPEEIPHGVTGAYSNLNEFTQSTTNAQVAAQMDIARSKRCPAQFIFAPSISNQQLVNLLAHSGAF